MKLWKIYYIEIKKKGLVCIILLLTVCNHSLKIKTIYLLYIYILQLIIFILFVKLMMNTLFFYGLVFDAMYCTIYNACVYYLYK